MLATYNQREDLFPRGKHRTPRPTVGQRIAASDAANAITRSPYGRTGIAHRLSRRADWRLVRRLPEILVARCVEAHQTCGTDVRANGALQRPGDHRMPANWLLSTRSLFFSSSSFASRYGAPGTVRCGHSPEYRQIASKATMTGRSFADRPPTRRNHSVAPPFGKQDIRRADLRPDFVDCLCLQAYSGAVLVRLFANPNSDNLVNTLTSNADPEMPANAGDPPVLAAQWNHAFISLRLSDAIGGASAPARANSRPRREERACRVTTSQLDRLNGAHPAKNGRSPQIVVRCMRRRVPSSSNGQALCTVLRLSQISTSPGVHLCV